MDGWIQIHGWLASRPARLKKKECRPHWYIIGCFVLPFLTMFPKTGPKNTGMCFFLQTKTTLPGRPEESFPSCFYQKSTNRSFHQSIWAFNPPTLMPLTTPTQWDHSNPVLNWFCVVLLEMDPKPYKYQKILYDFPIFPLRGGRCQDRNRDFIWADVGVALRPIALSLDRASLKGKIGELKRNYYKFIGFRSISNKIH